MKKILTSFLFLLISLNSYSSHMMGGEIIWQCLGPSAGANAGKYVFTVRFYRDCTGITPSTQTLEVWNHPAISTIALNAPVLTDLSPDSCFDGSGVLLNCNNAPFSSLGLIHEYRYVSGPVNLGNTSPPAAGWVFTWTECCRNTVQNTPAASSMLLRAKMFAYNTSPANPCYDNSPAFAEKPATYFCSGDTSSYSITAYDVELDSLIYAWDNPMDAGTTNTWPGVNVNFSAPYSVTNQLPGTSALNTQTGEITFGPPAGIGGNFVTCVRVDAFKCGIKVASVYREIQVAISSGCLPVLGGGINHAPNFSDTITSLPIYTFTDTVYAGDTVAFDFRVSDFDFNVNGIPQKITVDISGLQMGLDDTSQSTGCMLPPCATLDNPTPAVFPLGKNFKFEWVTDCNHVDTMCTLYYTNHFFVLKAFDNYCPAPAYNYKTITVAIRKLTIMNNGDTLFVDSVYTNLQWYLNGVAIPGATGTTYIATVIGNYTVQAATPAGCTLTSNSFNRTFVGINEQAFAVQSLEITPNPIANVCNIYAPAFNNAVLQFYDINGRIVFEETFNSATQVNTEFLLPGIYLIEVSDKEGRSVKGKVVKE